MDTDTIAEGRAKPWNKGKLLGQRPPLKLAATHEGHVDLPADEESAGGSASSRPHGT